MSITNLIILVSLVVIILFVIRTTKNQSSKSSMDSILRKYASDVSLENDTSRITADWEDIVFLDTETTGLNEDDEIVEIAIIDHDGKTLLNSLVKPTKNIPERATAIHNITNDMVSNAPTLEELTPKIIEAVQSKIIAIYNVEYDMKYLPNLEGVIFGTTCIMKNYAGNGRWKKLSTALAEVGGEWKGNSHRALSDALAARDIYLSMSTVVD